MDLLTLIEICSVAKDSALVLAIALTFSGGNVNTVRATKSAAQAEDAPTTRQAALAEIKRLVRAGDAPVAGLLPVTPAWARAFERPVEDLLDPCAGMGIGTAMLSQFEYECEETQGRKGRECVLHKYEHALGLDFFADEVRDFIAEQRMPAEGATVAFDSEAMLEAAVLFPGSTKRSWGADRIFVTTVLPTPKAAAGVVPPSQPEPAATPRAVPVTGGVRGSADRLKVAPLPALSAVHGSSPPALRVSGQ